MVSIILDVDTGVDDAWGLSLFLKNLSVNSQLIGITCVAGNTDVDNVCTNTLRILHLTGKTMIPVYRGATQSLINPDCHVRPGDSDSDLTEFHGRNGFGDVELPDLPEDLTPKAQHAVSFLHKTAAEYSGMLTLVCFGPLTNIALTVRMFPEFVKNIHEIFVMGGNYTAMGNRTMCAEFNFHSDPEAAHIVLSAFAGKLTILPWETCLLNCTIPYSWRESLAEGGGQVVQFFDEIEQPVIQRAKKLGLTSWINCDQLLASIILDRSIILETIVTHATVELNGHHTRGQLVRDHLNLKESNVKIITKVDTEKHKEQLLALKYW